MAKKRIRRPQPLAPPPQSSALRSRKRARQVTTLFHKYTRERDAAVARARAGGCPVGADDDGVASNLSTGQIELLAEVKRWDDKISEIGGRSEYQKASQLNTDLFSTSKWVLGILGRWGWLDGLRISSGIDSGSGVGGLENDANEKSGSSDNSRRKKGKKEKMPRRDVRLLEVGAINTQLLDAAARTRIRKNDGPISSEARGGETERVYRLDVQAIDVRSTDPRIQQMDFFDLPLPDSNQTASDAKGRYDAIVNSMVINCVTTPAQRGRMLSLCYRHLRPGGVCFLTLPRLCLCQSKFTSRSHFEEILMKGVGFKIVREVGRESPKVAFFVLRRPKAEGGGCGGDGIRSWDDKFTRMPVLHRGKKFRNTFAVTLSKEEDAG